MKKNLFKKVLAISLCLSLVASAMAFAETVADPNAQIKAAFVSKLDAISLSVKLSTTNATSWMQVAVNNATYSNKTIKDDLSLALAKMYSQVKSNKTLEIGDITSAYNLASGYTKKQAKTGSFSSNVGVHAFTTVVLSDLGVSFNVDNAINYISKNQLKSGLIRPSAGKYTTTEIIKSTALSILASNIYVNKGNAKQVRDLATNALKKAYKDGSFVLSNKKADNSSVCWAAIALQQSGVDIWATNFNSNTKSIANNFVSTDKALTLFTINAIKDNINGVDSKYNFTYLRNQLRANGTISAKRTVYVSVIGDANFILPRTKITLPTANGSLTVSSAVSTALTNAKIPFDISNGQYGVYIKSIGELSAAKFGGYDGFLYLLNGESPLLGVGEQKVISNDEIIIYYGDFSATKIANVTFEKPFVAQGADLKVKITYDETKYDSSYNIIGVETKPFENVNVTAFGKTFVSDATGQITIPAALLKNGSQTFFISQFKQNALPGAITNTNFSFYVHSKSEILKKISLKRITPAKISYNTNKIIGTTNCIDAKVELLVGSRCLTKVRTSKTGGFTFSKVRLKRYRTKLINIKIKISKTGYKDLVKTII